MFIVSLAVGFVLGLSLAAPPGPMNALIAKEAANHGVKAGIKMGLAAPVADTVFLALLLAGAQYLVPQGDQLRFIAAIGAMVMIRFAYTSWLATTQSNQPQPVTSFGAALVAAMTNPYQIAWWLTGGYLFLVSQGLWGIGGLMLGIFGWVVVFSWLMALGARRWQWFAPMIRGLSTILLLAFVFILLLVAFDTITV